MKKLSSNRIKVVLAAIFCFTVCAFAKIPADFTNDKTVNIQDLAVVCYYWLNDVTPFANGDVNGSGDVNLLDFTEIANQWLYIDCNAMTATASSQEGTDYDAQNAIDNNFLTRWSSSFYDGQWLIIDAKQRRQLQGLKIFWETAYASEYYVMLSEDNINWLTFFHTTTGDGEVDDITFTPTYARYIKIYCIHRATEWGNSIWEIQLKSADRCYKANSGSVIDKQIEFLISQMTIAEKIELIHGETSMDLPAIGRLGIPSVHMSDGPLGVRDGTAATAFPASIAISASWDVNLANQVGKAIAVELRNKGKNVILAPCMNIVRVPHGGRNFETFGEDPNLNSRMAVAYIKGVQSQNAIACAKHYACNNQEYERGTIDILVDRRALHEIYLPAFKASVTEAGVWSVMAAYNQVNGHHCTENEYLLKTVLKDEWGFKGFVVSDWWSVHSTVNTANNGLDVEMPSGGLWDNGQLLTAINNGQVSETTINDKVRRILRAIYKSGMTGEWSGQNGQTEEHNKLARDVATAGIVLLKNKNSILPLDSNANITIAAIGPNLYRARTGGGGSSQVTPYYSISPLQGLQNAAGSNITITRCAGSMLSENDLPPIDPSLLYVQDMSRNGMNAEYFNNTNLEGTAVLTRVDTSVDFDWSDGSPAAGINADYFSARWRGKLVVPTTGTYKLAMTTDDGFRLYLNGTLLISDWSNHSARSTSTNILLNAGQQYSLTIEYYENGGAAIAQLSCFRPDALLSEAVDKAADADAAILFMGLSNNLEGEGSDKASMSLPAEQIQLIQSVAAVNPNTVVVMFSGPQVDMNDWLGNVSAVMQAWYPGQECGNAVANILFGKENPSGKLPVTFIKRWADSPCYSNYPGNVYTEGIFVGYRYYDHANVEPLLPFGFGLSYTTFAYSNLSIDTNSLTSNGTFSVSLNVQNTGQRAGSEIVQLYIADTVCSVPRPPRELKAFEKIYLQPGETKSVKFTLDKGALSFYDAANSRWYAEPGVFRADVGSNSRDIRLSGSFEL
ncbi:MAG: glycoside hydrolase family 3 C-terminal domain-containing protein [Phycisphaerales bacterium]